MHRGELLQWTISLMEELFVRALHFELSVCVHSLQASRQLWWQGGHTEGDLCISGIPTYTFMARIRPYWVVNFFFSLVKRYTDHAVE